MFIASFSALRRTPFLLLALLLTIGESRASDPEYAPGEILVKFQDGTSDAEREAFEKQERLSLIVVIKSVMVHLYRLPEGVPVGTAVTRFMANPIVKYAEPNHTRGGLAVNDPLYPQQWSLQNTGQVVNGVSGVGGIDIRWAQAMAIFTPKVEVTVAVVDSGVGIDHEEIIESVWFNEPEVFGKDGFDDDRNGYVDDAFGYDFYGQDHIALDEHGHGTHVAGIIVGANNNNLGGAGISPTARVMSLRILNQFNRGGDPKYARVSDVALAWGYAADKGARVVNCSFGGGPSSQTELAALENLVSKGALVVMAAGNGGQDRVGDDNDRDSVYPAAYRVPDTIVVAAQDRSGGLARFSNFGAVGVDIAAPGTDILIADVTRRSLHTQSFRSSAPGWTIGSGNLNQSPYTWGITAAGLSDRLLGPSYSPFSDIWAQSPLLPTGLGTRLTFDTVFSLADDVVVVEASSNGFTWDVVGGLSKSSTTWSKPAFDLSSFDGELLYLRFRLVTNGVQNSGGVNIVNLEISAVDIRVGATPRFEYGGGTSFSAPMVSGVAALIMSQRPDIHAKAVRTAILSTARPIQALAGKIATGGMLDAEAALKYAMALPSPPVITRQPTAGTAEVGQSVVLTADATSSVSPSYQWYKNGVPIPYAVFSSLTLSNLQLSSAGSYTVVISNPGGPVRSNAANLSVVLGPQGWLSNLSVRTPLEANQTLIVGLVVKGGSKDLLIRGAGPALSGFGVSGAMPDPRTTVFKDGLQVAANDNWSFLLASEFQKVGAFGFAPGSLDSALLRRVVGSETIHVSGALPGVVLVEAYDTFLNGAIRLSNVSARNMVKTGDGVLIAGFTVSGTGPAKLLIRGIGPTLSNFGVSNVLRNPLIRVYDSAGRQVAFNDDWGAQHASTFALAGAFALPAGSPDAALAVQVPPGSYTVHVSGADGGMGEALVEIYEIP